MKNLKNILIKKFLYIFATLLLMFMGVFNSSFMFNTSKTSSADADQWDGTADTTFANLTLHAGTEEDPFLISSAEQLAGLSYIIKTPLEFYPENFNNSSVFYKLTTDVNLLLHQWVPIGNGTNKFMSNFDGNNHTIYSLRITQTQANVYHYGLFGYIEADVVVENIIMQFVGINSIQTEKIFIGGITGILNQGTIKKCSVGGSVATTSSGSGFTTESHVGGIVGGQTTSSSIANVIDCFNSASVSGYSPGVEAATNYVGGIVGNTTGMNIYKCYNTGTLNAYRKTNNIIYMGGLIGEAQATVIEKSYNSGVLNINQSSASSKIYVGGLIGHSVSAQISNSYTKFSINYASSPSGIVDNYAGGIVGFMGNYGTNYSAIYNSYSYILGLGSNPNPSYLGLFVGKVNNANCTNEKSYYLTISGYNPIAVSSGSYDIQGVNSAQMASQATFNDWDFETTWNMPTEGTNISPILIGVGNNLDDKAITYNFTHGGGWAEDFDSTPFETYEIGGEIITLPTEDNVYYLGHVFLGWYDNDSLTGEPVLSIPENSTENLEYWAKWGEAVARIDDKYYLSLQDAIDDVVIENTTIYIMVNSITLSQQIELADNKKFTIMPDNNVNVTIKRIDENATYPLFNIDNGELTISGNSITSSMLTLDGLVSVASSGDSPLILISENGKLVLQNLSSVESNNGSGIKNYGILNLYGGNIVSNDGYSIENCGQIILNGNANIGGYDILFDDDATILQNISMTVLEKVKIYLSTFVEQRNIVVFDNESLVNLNTYELNSESYYLYADGFYLKIGKDYVLTYNINNSTLLTINENHRGQSSFNLTDIETLGWSYFGHTFLGWNTDGGTIVMFDDEENITMPNQDETLYAVWETNTYTITFDYNDATSGNTIPNKDVTYDEAIGELPEPTKLGYNFLGWFWGEDFLNKASEEDIYTFTEDKILYAKFEILTYNINLIVTTSILGGGSNGATIETSTYEVEFGEDLIFELNLNEGYGFVEVISQNSNYFTQEFNEETSIITISNISADDTFEIVVMLHSYSVTLIGGTGGTPYFESGFTSTVYYGNSVTVNAGVISGYRFVEWLVNGEGEIVDNIQNPITISNIKSNITLTASYVKTYTISLTSNGNGLVQINELGYLINASATFDVNSVVTISALTDETGYEFKRWLNGETLFSELLSTQITIVSDINLTAVFGLIGYTITFNVAGNGTVLCNENTMTNYEMVDFVYGDNAFIEFASSKGIILKSVAIITINGTYNLTQSEIDTCEYSVENIQENMTFEVEFVEVIYNVVLNTSSDVGNGGTAQFEDLTSEKDIKFADLPLLIEAVTFEGYSFKFWTLNGVALIEDLNTALTYVTDIDEDIILTAHFEIVKLTFTINYNGEFGTVSYNDETVESGSNLTINYGSDLNFVLTPISSGYYVDSITLNEEDIFDLMQENNLTIQNVTEDSLLLVLFDVFKYNITTHCDFADVNIEIWLNGELTAQRKFAFQTEITIKSTYAGYQFLSYTINGVTYNSDTTTLTITEDLSVVGNYLARISTNVCYNGQVKVNDLSSGYFAYGAIVAVIAIGDLGYKFVSWVGDYGAESQFSLTVTKSITFSALFASKDVIVTISTTEFGSLTGSSPNGTDYKIGDQITLRATILYEGYEFLGWQGNFNGEFLTHLLITTYTITAQDAEQGNVELFAEIQVMTFTVIIGSNAGGAINISGTFTYDYNDQIVVQIQIQTYYYLKNILYNDLNIIDQLNQQNEIALIVKENFTVFVEFAPNLWTENFNNNVSGTGSKDSPYLISNASQLAFACYAINNGLENNGIHFNTAYYKLINDIDLTGNFWTAIGIDETNKIFNGVFDFNFHTISNLRLYDTSLPTLYDGLFGVVGIGRVINQNRNFFILIMTLVGIIILVGFSALAVFIIEKKRRIPKKNFIIPKNFKIDKQ